MHASAFIVCVIFLRHCSADCDEIYCWGKCQGLWTDFSFIGYRAKVELFPFICNKRQSHYINFTEKETEQVLKKLFFSLQMNTLSCQNDIFVIILTAEVVYLH